METANNDYYLIFAQPYDRDQGLDYGLLSLDSLSQGCINIWRATSSIASKQEREGFQQL